MLCALELPAGGGAELVEVARAEVGQAKACRLSQVAYLKTLATELSATPRSCSAASPDRGLRPGIAQGRLPNKTAAFLRPIRCCSKFVRDVSL